MILKDLERSNYFKTLLRTRPFNDEPKFYQYTCDVKGLDEEFLGSGIALNDTLAQIKAVGETIERTALGRYGKLMSFSYAKQPSGIKAADPTLWINYKDAAREEVLERVRNSVLQWSRADDLLTGEEIYIPAQLVYIPYEFNNEIVLRSPVSTGAAYGASLEDATMRGIMEIVERDAFMLNYLKKNDVSQVDHPTIRKIKKYFSRYRLDLHLLEMQNDLNIPVIFGVVVDKTGLGPALAAGLKANTDPVQAAIGAALESEHVRSWLRYSYIIDGTPAIKSPEDITSLKTRGYYWFPKGSEKNLSFWLNSKTRELESTQNEKSLADILALCRERGYHAYRVSLDTQEAPGSAVKVLIPEMQPLRLIESKKVFGTKKLYEGGSGEFNMVPHPFT